MKQKILIKAIMVIILIALAVWFGWYIGNIAGNVNPDYEGSNNGDVTQNDSNDLKGGDELKIDGPSDEMPSYFKTSAIEYTPIKEIADSVIVGNHEQEIIDAYYADWGTADQRNWKSYLESLFAFYDVGDIKTGPYEGWKLLILELECDGPCFSTPLYRFAWDKDTDDLVLLQKHSYDYIPEHLAPLVYSKDISTSIDGLSLPKEIEVPGKGITLILGDQDVAFEPAKGDSYTSAKNYAFTHPTLGDFYFVSRGSTESCLYVRSEDGSVARYEFDPGFFDEGSTIEWLDGSTSQLFGEYNYVSTGCGITGNCTYTFDADDEDMKLVGSSSSGINLYELIHPADMSDDVLKANGLTRDDFTAAQSQFWSAYSTYKAMPTIIDADGVEQPRGELMNFEDFSKDHNMLFWKEPFGRWTNIVNNKAKAAVECGKPVIYLYPQEETDVNVQVDIDEFTATDPEYGRNGWNVKAYPDGRIYNYADGKDYPYLFWEGKKKGGVTPGKGFVISRDEVSDFLDVSLDKLGLNSQEKADFVEFWEPRMLKNQEPYLFVSFFGTQEFNKVAPLSIDPKPDTLIRVFMYYHPLNNRIDVMPQELTKIPRRGFTVIEWGGTSSSLWQY